MPTTINGIGTHYYGKANIATRTAACHTCGRVGTLQSYDTRLWFVVVFIPVIPLGRKRVMDECPACRRHFVAHQAEYLRSQEQSLTSALEQFRANPTRDAAVAVHAQMLAFAAHDAAQSFRDEALAMYSDDALLHAALALQLDETHQPGAATPLFERALALDQNLPEARDGLARQRIADGKLDEARALIHHLEQPGVANRYPLQTLHELAKAYRRAGRHEESLALCRHLLNELPNLRQNRDFRKLVHESEKCCHHLEALIPESDSWLAVFNPNSVAYSSRQRVAAYLALLLLCGAAGMGVANEFYRQHRTVVVCNEFGPAVQVVIDDGLIVPPGKQHSLILPEGTHHVSVSGTINGEFDLEVRTGYWQRWTNNPAWQRREGFS